MNQSFVWRTSMHYGALSGIAVFAFYFALYASGNSMFGPISLLGIWIPVVFIVLATRFHRDHNLGGSLTYAQGLTIGLLTTLFSALLFGLSFYLFGTLYATELLDSYKAQAASGLEEGKSVISEQFIDQAMEGIEKATMSSLAFSESFNKVLWGLIVSLITAGVMKRKPAAASNDDWQS